MNRRELIAVLGSTAAFSWPGAVRAQQAAIPVVGFLHSGSPETLQHLLSGFHQGLAETGFVEGQNVKIEYRWARGQYNQCPLWQQSLLIIGTRFPSSESADSGIGGMRHG